MVNQQHLDILKKGKKTWNKWREEHPEIQPDLSGVDLSDMILKKCNFAHTNLSSANLKEADLTKASFYEANLSGANLSNAYMHGAILFQADFNHANLSRVDLSEAYLDKANFTGAILVAADLADASLKSSNFCDACFSEAREDVFGRAYFNAADLLGANLYQANLKRADLRGVNFYKAVLQEADFRDAQLCQANLIEVNLWRTNLSDANLSEAVMDRTQFLDADLGGANLREASLIGAVIQRTNFNHANLSQANLRGIQIVETNLTGAILTGCLVYGVSVWDVQMEGVEQSDLVITMPSLPTITVDNLKVAQSIYLMLNNQEIRGVIDTITKKAVLILGRFSSEQKPILNALRNELRTNDYLPILFDFEKPDTRDFTETVRTIAHLSRFIIADLTDPRSVPFELASIVPDLPSVPVQPILLASAQEFALIDHLRRYHWFLPIYRYPDQVSLPTLLKFQRRQYVLRAMLRTILDRVLQEACKAKRLLADSDMHYDLIFPEIDVDDHQVLAASTQMLVSALTVAKQQGWVSDETAMRLIFQFAGEEMDIHEELARIRTTGKE